MDDQKRKDVEVLNANEGAFLSSLTRNNSKIRADRAATIADDAELVYRRKVEDIDIEIKKLKRDRESALDLSPTNAMSLMAALDFSAEGFVAQDMSFTIKIREKGIERDLAAERFKYLFGKEI
ncbi:MAG: hypothetical protein WC279_14180 [Sulfurimonas sp.]|jgi:hypothetical protein|uniref:hypothetical protein n=1 Tax=Sulfurimonas sp. TaxID=2022749 RepID=UPI003567CC29